MSTRRARIKAVASLPVRRKIATNKDSNIVNQSVTNVAEQPKIDVVESVLKAAAESKQQSTGTESQSRRSPVTSEKVPVITPTSLYKNVLNSSISSPQVIKSSPIKPTELQKSALPGSSNIELKRHNALSASRKYESDSDTEYAVFSKNNVSKPVSTEGEAVVDGIVPLQSVPTKPKPLDLLKNEIISENAEALFDPIVPLPSPSKVRPKLRPVPRLAPLRRNSIQGSASESEDDTRRALHGGNATPIPSRQRHDSHTSFSTQNSTREVSRIRNDSVCSIASQPTSTQGPGPPSPTKEKHTLTKFKNAESTRRTPGTRRRQRPRDPNASGALTMYDLIFYNPTTNPIVHDKDEENISIKAKVEVEVEMEHDDIEKEDTAAPVPQIKLGPNGEIILDEKSLVIEQTEGARKLSRTVVREGGAGGGRGRYTRAPRTAEWSDAETLRYYRALSAVGTDFSLMTPLFPDRNRRDLKLKFKKEERLNCPQVDKALRSQVQWDLLRLQGEFKKERLVEAANLEKERKIIAERKAKENERIRTARKMGLKISHGIKAVDTIPSGRITRSSKMSSEEVLDEIKNRRRKQAEKKSVILSPLPALKPTQIVQPILTPIAVTQNTTPTPAMTPHGRNVTEDAMQMATITRIDTPKKPNNTQYISQRNIEKGSLVVLSVNDPKSPSKKILQTYISDGNGSLTPVALPSSVLSSVVGFMRNGMPHNMASTSPQIPSTTSTSGVIQLNPSPTKNCTITHL